MATIRAVTSGLWSDPATWLPNSPAPGDTVVSNGFSVSVDGTFVVVQVRNDGASFGLANGGAFFLLSGSDLSCTGGITVNSTTTVIQCSVGVGLQATLRASIGTFAATSGFNGIVHSGTGTLNIFGSVSFAGGNSGGRWAINCNNGGTLNITGNVATTGGGGAGGNNCILMSGGNLFIQGVVSGGGIAAAHIIQGTNCNIVITGQVSTSNVANITNTGPVRVTGIPGSVTNTGAGFSIISGGGAVIVDGSVTVNGNGGGISAGGGSVSIGGSVTCTSAGNGITTTGGAVTIGTFISCAAAGQGVNVTTGTVNVSGSVTIGGSGIGVVSTTGTITIGGNITASTTNVAVSSQGLVRCSGLLYNTSNIQAVYAPRITIEPSTSSITFQKIGGGDQIMYIGTSDAANLPAVGNVRLGTTYGAANEFTGTMIVPVPTTVSLGTPVDNTVGTFLMTPASFVQELGVSTIPVAVRLQNSSTVITTGDQLVSYNI
jgi:hypothetical protein